ncbi:MAG: NnrU family protein [Alphaproteobacteria bacterium]|nr:NnrU family protein [Alphaproteobacteria bacterium]
MWVLVLGLLLFFIPHSLKMIVPGPRAAFIAARGEGPWKGLVALPSLVGIGLMIWGWMLYRDSAPELYAVPDWGVHVAAVTNLVGLMLLMMSGGPVGRIKALIRHPMSIGIALWGLGHLVSNGDLASLLLFGAWTLYSVVAAIVSTLRGDPAPVFQSVRGDLTGILIGLGLYLAFVYFLHGWMFGIQPPVI